MAAAATAGAATEAVAAVTEPQIARVHGAACTTCRTGIAPPFTLRSDGQTLMRFDAGFFHGLEPTTPLTHAIVT